MTTGQKRLAQAATLIAALTLLARIAGFVRTMVFARAVGPTCLGSTYQTANSVPNILYEVVAGGALATLVIPLIAGHADRGEDDSVRRIASALLTWAVVILIPLALAVVVFATPIMRFLLGDLPCDGALEAGTRMLRVFAPQVVLYGIAVIYAGVGQSYGRFAGPALAPLLSSVVVIASYLVFAVVAPPDADLGTVTVGQEMILAVGTTLGVAVLCLTMVLPTLRTPMRWRLRMRMPERIAGSARTLAIWGAVALGAQQLALVVTLRLGNSGGQEGTVVIYNLAYAVFLLPWAVLAVPLATSAFPVQSAQWTAGDRDGFGRTTSSTARSVTVVGFLSAAMVFAAAWPTAAVVVEGANGPPATAALARSLAILSPALVAMSLNALLQRSLNAVHRPRAASLCMAAGFGASMLLTVVLSAAMPSEYRAEALAAATSAGLVVSAVLLLVTSRSRLGSAALVGTRRTLAVSALGGVLGGVAGRLVSDALGENPPLVSVLQAVAAAAVAALAFLGVAVVFDREAVLRLVRRRTGGGPPGSPGEGAPVPSGANVSDEGGA